MAKAYKNKARELDAPNPRPIFSNAYDYYIDYYSEEEESTFYIIKDEWTNIYRNNDLSQKLTETELKLISLVSTLIKRSPLGLAYFSLEYLCAKLGITDRQLRAVRKNINHIFSSRWRKASRIDGVLKKNVYVFVYTIQGRNLLGTSVKYYESVKVGSGLPTSINKDEKYINNRSSKSNFYKNSDSLVLAEKSTRANQQKVTAKKECEANTTQTSKIILLKQHKRASNKRKKPTNAEIKSKQAKFLYFQQYDKQKSLGDHYPLSQEDCAKLQITSGRDFTLNAMNEILQDISRKPKESRHQFPSKTAFMAYMSKVYRYEGRDAVKTSNSSFKIIARATEAEVIAYTTQTQRDEFMAIFEQAAIDFPTPENRFKAKIACTLPPMIGYNLLSSIKSISFKNDMLEICLVNQLNIDHHKQAIVKEAKAVDCKIDCISVYCS